ncbi:MULTISPECIES: hypothetical protein [Flammeovirga]|nr:MULTISPECIES: hypothetical protein [Flammeovirga]MBB6462180.1 hypothetical protein [Flammeovirga kamogawensis]
MFQFEDKNTKRRLKFKKGVSLGDLIRQGVSKEEIKEVLGLK